jgi:hypothetical protein
VLPEHDGDGTVIAAQPRQLEGLSQAEIEADERHRIGQRGERPDDGPAIVVGPDGSSQLEDAAPEGGGDRSGRGAASVVPWPADHDSRRIARPEERGRGLEGVIRRRGENEIRQAWQRFEPAERDTGHRLRRPIPSQGIPDGSRALEHPLHPGCVAVDDLDEPVVEQLAYGLTRGRHVVVVAPPGRK